MEWHVVIEGQSPMAPTHALATNHFIPRPPPPEGKDPPAPTLPAHPILHCTSVDVSHANLLRVVLKLPTPDSERPTALWIPYSHVLAIMEVGDGKPPFMGFNPS